MVIFIVIGKWFMQEASYALDAGASVLLPPVHERLDLLLLVLPEDPSAYMGLTYGQVRKGQCVGFLLKHMY